MSIITFFVKKASAILKFIKKLLHKKFIVIKLACFRDESSACPNVGCEPRLHGAEVIKSLRWRIFITSEKILLKSEQATAK